MLSLDSRGCFPRFLPMVVLVVVALFSAAPLAAASGGRPDTLFRIIAYVRGNAMDIEQYPLQHLTHINYCFLHLKGNTLVLGGERDSIAISRLVALKKVHPGLKVLFSVGGWGGCEPCSGVFAAADGRHEFAISALELLQHFGADGIDLDWEYPAIEGYPGHPYSGADRHNFTLLVAELRKVFGNGYEVTFAGGGFLKFLKESVEWDQVMPLVDYVNVMSYDLVNGYSTVTGHHTSLYSTPRQMESTDFAVRFLDSLGVPPQKIVIGAAFYARVWQDVKPGNNGLFQEGKFTSYVRFNQFDEIFGTGSSFTTYWDSTARAPYAYDSTNRLFATFDDRQSVALKTEYAIHKGLGGIMFWELTGDVRENGLLTTMANTALRSPRPRQRPPDQPK